jgi:hypothetical protein
MKTRIPAILTILTLALSGYLAAKPNPNPSLQDLGAQANVDTGYTSSKIPNPVAMPVDEKAQVCRGYSMTMRLRSRTVELPAKGRWTLESHLATQDDSFPKNRLFPKSSKENVSEHLARSCAEVQKFVPAATCDEIYNNRWTKVWTPPEGGKAGQGARGNLRPPSGEEPWIFNMMWVGKSMPAPGTKFLASFKGRHVVVVGGYEKGPASGRFLGGFQPEVFWYLGAEWGSSKVKLSALTDQGLPAGPIDCGGSKFDKD